MRTALALCVLVLGCGKSQKDEKMPSLAEMKAEAAVEWAHKQLPDLDQRLASTDPGAASSICSVIKPDLASIEKADADLAAQIKQRCFHDLRVRELAVAIDKAEIEQKTPSSVMFGCSRVASDLQALAKDKLDTDPAVVALAPRIATVCPKH